MIRYRSMHLRRTFWKWLVRSFLIMPMLWSVLISIYFGLCSMELGGLPRPSVHDPKDFGFDWLGIVVWVLMYIVVYTGPLMVVCVAFLRKRLRISTGESGVFLAGVYGVIYFLVLDPFAVLTWLLD